MAAGGVHRTAVAANPPAMSSNEAFSRARIDEQLREVVGQFESPIGVDS
jgi:hypothetical protein